MKTFKNYIHRISTEPSYYGSSVTTGDAAQIVAKLTLLIEKRFPGIEIETCEIGRNIGITTGPHSTTCAEIDEWVAGNWTKALA